MFSFLNVGQQTVHNWQHTLVIPNGGRPVRNRPQMPALNHPAS
jgi:hypothetical protein